MRCAGSGLLPHITLTDLDRPAGRLIVCVACGVSIEMPFVGVSTVIPVHDELPVADRPILRTAP